RGRRRGSPLQGRKIAPKYRGPSGETWAGRGAKPRWLVDAIKGGKKIENFLIDKSARKGGKKRKTRKWFLILTFEFSIRTGQLRGERVECMSRPHTSRFTLRAISKSYRATRSNKTTHLLQFLGQRISPRRHQSRKHQAASQKLFHGPLLYRELAQ